MDSLLPKLLPTKPFNTSCEKEALEGSTIRVVLKVYYLGSNVTQLVTCFLFKPGLGMRLHVDKHCTLCATSYSHIFVTGSEVNPKTTRLSDDLLPKAVALYDFIAGSDQEISFKVR